MYIFGKIIGGLLGFFTLGLIGAAVGVVAGHFFDVGLKKTFNLHSPEQLQKVQLVYFKTVFRLLGALAKADGRVSEQEIKQTEEVMLQMGLTDAHRKQAILYFKEGSQTEFNIPEAVEQFSSACGEFANLKQLLLDYLITLALADDHLDDAEDRVLQQIAEQLGFGQKFYQHMLRMAAAQKRFAHNQQQEYSEQHDHTREEQSHRQQRGSNQSHSGDWRNKFSAGNELETAYSALGVTASATDAEIKKAYRKLMSQYHPDKLMGQGVPDDMIKVATEKSQEIQRAYELVKKSRG